MSDWVDDIAVNIDFEELLKRDSPSSSNINQVVDTLDEKNDNVVVEEEGQQIKPSITEAISSMIPSPSSPISPLSPDSRGTSNIVSSSEVPQVLSSDISEEALLRTLPLPEVEVMSMFAREREAYKNNLDMFRAIYKNKTGKRNMPAVFVRSAKLLADRMKNPWNEEFMQQLLINDNVQDLKELLKEVKEEMQYRGGFTKAGYKIAQNLVETIETRIAELDSWVDYKTRSPQQSDLDQQDDGQANTDDNTMANSIAGNSGDSVNRNIPPSAGSQANSTYSSTGLDNGDSDSDIDDQDENSGTSGPSRRKNADQDSVSKALKTKLKDGDYQTVAKTVTVTTVRKGKRPQVERDHQSSSIPLNNSTTETPTASGPPAPKRKRKIVVFCYETWQPAYDTIKKENGSNVTWIQGLPDDPFKHFKPFRRAGLLILDDAMAEVGEKAKKVINWFTKGSHHKNISIAILLQNIFPEKLRTISVNAHIIVIFRNPRDRKQTQQFVNQVFPYQAERVQNALTYAFQINYRPLVLNLHQHVPEDLAMSVDLFPEDLKVSGQPFTQILLPQDFNYTNT
ncbi:hypothetical protein AC249_AIPGENE24554 [Exaiptasia diaphana]|nr:hypothetical protein AC249_AIPGENE24554 [Exaiptasia diaphana]